MNVALLLVTLFSVFTAIFTKIYYGLFPLVTFCDKCYDIATVKSD
jgi:hypothetical protein